MQAERLALIILVGQAGHGSGNKFAQTQDFFPYLNFVPFLPTPKDYPLAAANTMLTLYFGSHNSPSQKIKKKTPVVCRAGSKLSLA